MALGSPPDRRPEGDDLSEEFIGQLGGEEIFQEPLVAAGPDRSGRVARAERSQSNKLVARPAVLFPGPARDADGTKQFLAPELAILPGTRLGRHVVGVLGVRPGAVPKQVDDDLVAAVFYHLRFAAAQGHGEM